MGPGRRWRSSGLTGAGLGTHSLGGLRCGGQGPWRRVLVQATKAEGAQSYGQDQPVPGPQTSWQRPDGQGDLSTQRAPAPGLRLRTGLCTEAPRLLASPPGLDSQSPEPSINRFQTQRLWLCAGGAHGPGAWATWAGPESGCACACVGGAPECCPGLSLGASLLPAATTQQALSWEGAPGERAWALEGRCPQPLATLVLGAPGRVCLR